MEDYGFPPHILPGLGAHDSWGKQILYCRPRLKAFNDNLVKEGAGETFAPGTSGSRASSTS